MRPEDLKFPFAPGKHHVLLEDRVWHIPNRGVENDPFVFPGWSDKTLFGNTHPVSIEFCSGNGAWIADKAEKNPEINWVAVEKKFVRARKIWSKIKNRGLQNLIVICGEAQYATEKYIKDESVIDVYINFPDPWPKNRHAKHRLIQTGFANQLWRVLNEGKSLTFVTDDVPYSEWFIEVMGSHPGFSSQIPDPFFVTEQTDYGSSYFDELWRAKGRAIRYHQFKKEKMPICE